MGRRTDGARRFGPAGPVTVAALLVAALVVWPATAGSGQPVDDGETEAPCVTTTTTTTLPPVIGVGFTKRAAVADPCPQTDDEQPPEPEETTTTTAPPRIVALDDTIEAIQGEDFEPVDVTDNDTIDPAIGGMEILSGEMPAGMKLWIDNSLAGWVIGTPTECGTFEVDYSVTAATRGDDAPTASASVTVEVTCDPSSAPLVATDDEIQATEGERIEVDLVANDSPSVGIRWIELVSGDLPGGITLWAGGWLTGSPTEPGEFEFTYRINGVGGAAEIATVSLTVS